MNAGKIGNNMQLEMKVISDLVTYYEEVFDIHEVKNKATE